MEGLGDVVFLNEVLKRLARAGEEKVRIQKERDTLKRERNELQQILEGQTRTAPVEQYVEPEAGPSRTVDFTKLNELEEGIKHAQESYEKTEAKLKANNAKIEDLARVNESLRHERNKLQARCQGLQSALSDTERQLKEALVEVDRLRAQLSAPRMDTADGSKANAPIHTPDDVVTLKLEVQRLSRENRALQDDKERCKQDLEAASLRLSKIKTSDRGLREHLAKLSEMRQKSEHSRASSIASSNQPGRPRLRSDASAQSSHSIANIPSVSVPKSPSGSSTKPPVPVQKPNRRTTRASASFIDLTDIDQEVEDEAPTPRQPFHFPSMYDGLPLTRRSELAHLPAMSFDIPTSEEENLFSRERMAHVLGGSHQPLVVKVSGQNAAWKGRDVSSYLCPGLDHNPWCPAVPGQHGYIFVGLGREAATFAQPETHHVFCGVKRGKNTRRFRYVGKYSAVRVNPLTVAEWESLDLKVRTTYAKTTKEKNKDSRSVEEIVAAYSSGELAVPCIKLQCIGFDANLYQAMVGGAPEFLKPKASLSSVSSNKRALGEYEADAEVSIRKRRLRAVKRTS